MREIKKREDKLFKDMCIKIFLIITIFILLVYFNNPVGIGEHPQHLEEMDKFVDKMTNAKDKLEI